MSHFSVLVHIPFDDIKDDSNGDEIVKVLSDKLQPFHEFECTGVKDQYVLEYDETEEQLDEYNTDTMEALFCGSEFIGSKYSEQCGRFKVRDSLNDYIFPEGYELRMVNVNEIYTFEEFLTKWKGYSFNGIYSDYRDGRFYRYSNPNRQWDWWTVGGRWEDHFITKSGEKGDAIQVHEWDLEGATKRAEDDYMHFYDTYINSGLNDLPYMTWEECREECLKYKGRINSDDVRDMFHSQEIKLKLKDLFPSEYPFGYIFHDVSTFYNVSREDFIKARVYGEIGTFAILTDGKWLEKGDMGWFAMVSNENSNWENIFIDTVKSFNDNDYLILVDCHI